MYLYFTGSIEQIQKLLDCDILKSLKKIFDEENLVIQREIAWIIANVTNFGTPEQLTLMTTKYATLFQHEQISELIEDFCKLKERHDREKDGEIKEKFHLIIEAIIGR